jgi:hypothetical protein
MTIDIEPKWKFGEQVKIKEITILYPLYNKLVNAPTVDDKIDAFLELSNFFVKHIDEIRNWNDMKEREFASLVGFRLEEFAYLICDDLKNKYRLNVDIEGIEGKNPPMIIIEKDGRWVGQSCDLSVGKWVYRPEYRKKFFIPSILIESKRYIAVGTNFENVCFLATQWKKKYPASKFIVFCEHNDMDPTTWDLKKEVFAADIAEIFFIKTGSRNIERKGINTYRKDELKRFADVLDNYFKNIK